ncbi:MAG: glycosyltransferase [Clostridiales bacterium]|nr:glycosyltransferase [Clostridiales bacterium]
MEPLVSIIVPVFNARDYIGRCVDSILNQEYQNLEILLIDDGSSDGTGALLDAYAKKDARVRVIHQKNSGVSATRNHALDLAHGEFIQFADSDDWLTPDSTKLFVRSMLESRSDEGAESRLKNGAESGSDVGPEKRCDMVITDFYRVTGKRVSQKGDIDADHLMDRREFASYMVENPADFYYGVLWNKFFRRSIIEEHQIRMDVKLDWCEDFLFNLEYIRYAEGIRAIQAPVYYYMNRKDSLVSQGMSISNTIRMKSTVFDYYNAFYRDVYEEDYDEVKQKVRMFLISMAWDGFVMPAGVPGTAKLGEERVRLAGQSVSLTPGILADLYYFRKLLEYYLGLSAMLKQITLDEALLLLLLENSRQFEDRKEISELAGLNAQKTSRALQRLKHEKLIEFDPDAEERISIELLEKSKDYLDEIHHAVEECKRACLKDFSKEDAALFLDFMEKACGNMRKKLSQVSFTVEMDTADPVKNSKKSTGSGRKKKLDKDSGVKSSDAGLRGSRLKNSSKSEKSRMKESKSAVKEKYEKN